MLLPLEWSFSLINPEIPKLTIVKYIDLTMLNKILADQQRVRGNIHQHVGFIPRMQRGFNI